MRLNHGDDRKVLLACNPGDDMRRLFRVKFTAIIHDHGARIFRMIGVADIDRDVFLLILLHFVLGYLVTCN